MAKQYDPRQVAVIVNGQEVVGFADGTMINVARRNPRWDVDVGAQGDVVGTRSADDTAVATITLQHTSPSNALLTQIWKEQDEPGFELGFSAQDRNFEADVSTSGSNGRITNLPDWERGGDVADVEWEIIIYDHDVAFEGAE